MKKVLAGLHRRVDVGRVDAARAGGSSRSHRLSSGLGRGFLGQRGAGAETEQGSHQGRALQVPGRGRHLNVRKKGESRIEAARYGRARKTQV